MAPRGRRARRRLVCRAWRARARRRVRPRIGRHGSHGTARLDLCLSRCTGSAAPRRSAAGSTGSIRTPNGSAAPPSQRSRGGPARWTDGPGTRGDGWPPRSGRTAGGPMPDGASKDAWVALLRGFMAPAGMATLDVRRTRRHGGDRRSSPFRQTALILAGFADIAAGSLDTADAAAGGGGRAGRGPSGGPGSRRSRSASVRSSPLHGATPRPRAGTWSGASRSSARRAWRTTSRA